MIKSIRLKPSLNVGRLLLRGFNVDESNSTGERLLTGYFDRFTVEHLHRYALTRRLDHGKDVLDIASGEGYGSNLLASVANTVIGVDIDPMVVRHAKNKYSKNNLDFLTGSCSSIPLEPDSVDLVVSFETLEHHDQHEEMRCIQKSSACFVKVVFS